MKNEFSANAGIKLLVKEYRKIFRIHENLNHYSEQDYQAAERKFLKYALDAGHPGIQSLALKTP